MQIVRELGENEDKVLQNVDELTPELGLNLGGAAEEMKDSDGDDTERIVSGGMPNFNIDPEIFSHNNPAYQELASSSNSAAEKLLGLEHAETSMLHAKEALKSIPEDLEGEDEDEDLYAGEGGSFDSESEDHDDNERWLDIPCTISLEGAEKDLRKKYKEAMKETEPEDPILKNISQFYKGTLKM